MQVNALIDLRQLLLDRSWRGGGCVLEGEPDLDPRTTTPR